MHQLKPLEFQRGDSQAEALIDPAQLPLPVGLIPEQGALCPISGSLADPLVQGGPGMLPGQGLPALAQALAKVETPATAEPPPQQAEITANDRRFLRSLRIAADEMGQQVE